MKNVILLILTMLSVLNLKAQKDSTAEPLAIGETRTIHSKSLGEDRVLNINLPQTYDASRSYPVLYLLDGSLNEDFLHICGLVQFFNLQFKTPEFIIVGIANVDRQRDFTYPTDLEDLKKDLPTAGHSAAFIQFLEKELQPYIEKTYSTNGTKYLIGQSLGGLLATEVLLKNTDLFTHYLIVSPSLWWDDESMLKQAASLFAQQQFKQLYVYISVGKGERPVMRRDAKKLYEVLKTAKRPGLTLDFNLMKKENHATILHNSIYEGLLELFPYKE
ncbi:MAG: alpha/beta hydrolase [Lewinella sp.]|nr:alpha/beta hydrolase [Lewinella sp.]